MAFEKDLTPVQIRQFKEVFLPSLQNQVYKDFTLFILADNVRAFKGSESNKNIIKGICSHFSINCTTKAPERFKYDVEIRLDYDDEVSPMFLQRVVSEYKSGPETFLLSFTPTVVDSKTGQKHKHRHNYSGNFPSMCIALIQKGIKMLGVYDRPHIKMGKHVGSGKTIEKGYFFLHVHGENTLSKIHS